MSHLLLKHLHNNQLQHLHATGWAAWHSLLQGLSSAHDPFASSGWMRAETASSNSSCNSSSVPQTLSNGCSSCHGLNIQEQDTPRMQQEQQHSDCTFLLTCCQQPQQQQQTFLELPRPGNANSGLSQAHPLSATLQSPSCKLAALQDTSLAAQQPYQLQQQRFYHRSQHNARILTTKLKQKNRWQDLQLAFDTSGSGKSLNAIHLTTMLLQLTRVAPKAELVPANERQQLQQFTQELVSACHAKLLRMDHRGLSSYLQSLIALSYNVHQQPLPAAAGEGLGDQQHGPQSSSGSGSSMFTDILQAAVKQVGQADAHSCAALCSSLATLLQQQQQQQQQGQDVLQQGLQQQLLQKVVTALTQRIYSMLSGGHMTADKACRLCFAAARLAAAIRGSATSATTVVESAAASATSASTHASAAAESALADATSAADLADVAADLRSLVLLTAQQAAAAVTAAATADALLWREPLISPQDGGLFLSSLAKTRAWPGWETLLPLLQQYSWGVAAAFERSASGYGSSSSSRNRRRQSSLSSAAAMDDGSGSSAAAESAIDQISRSLPPTIWAVGRLLEQHQQQWWKRLDHTRQQQQLQHYVDLWNTLDNCVLAGTQLIAAADPAQLAQLAAGMSKVVTASGRVVIRAKACLQADQQQQQKLVVDGPDLQQSVEPMQPPASVVTPGGARSAVPDDQHVSVASDLQQLLEKLSRHLESPDLQELLRLHVSKVESLLPLMPLNVRLQIANSYRQLGVQVPKAVSLVFGRDTASDQQTQLFHV